MANSFFSSCVKDWVFHRARKFSIVSGVLYVSSRKPRFVAPLQNSKKSQKFKNIKLEGDNFYIFFNQLVQCPFRNKSRLKNGPSQDAILRGTAETRKTLASHNFSGVERSNQLDWFSAFFETVLKGCQNFFRERHFQNQLLDKEVEKISQVTRNIFFVVSVSCKVNFSWDLNSVAEFYTAPRKDDTKSPLSRWGK